MSTSLALGLLIPFAGHLGVKLICLWLDIRRAVAAALSDSDALAAGKAGEGSHIQQELTRG